MTENLMPGSQSKWTQRRCTCLKLLKIDFTSWCVLECVTCKIWQNVSASCSLSNPACGRYSVNNFSFEPAGTATVNCSHVLALTMLLTLIGRRKVTVRRVLVLSVLLTNKKIFLKCGESRHPLRHTTLDKTIDRRLLSLPTKSDAL